MFSLLVVVYSLSPSYSLIRLQMNSVGYGRYTYNVARICTMRNAPFIATVPSCTMARARGDGPAMKSRLYLSNATSQSVPRT